MKVNIYAMFTVMRHGDGIGECFGTPEERTASLRAFAEECADEDEATDGDDDALMELIGEHGHEVSTFDSVVEVTEPKVWACQLRRAEADSEDFNIISLHRTLDGAKAAAEADAKEIGETEFEWYLDMTGQSHLYSLAPDADVDCACYLVEEWTVNA
jgi:hypothetical protein